MIQFFKDKLLTFVTFVTDFMRMRQGITARIAITTSSEAAEMGDRGHNTHGPKRGGGAVPLSRSAGNPSNTMWPAQRSTSVPSGVFINPAVWPQ